MVDANIEGAGEFVGAQKAKFDTLVTEHPLAAVMGALIGGIVVGMLISRQQQH